MKRIGHMSDANKGSVHNTKNESATKKDLRLNARWQTLSRSEKSRPTLELEQYI